MQARLEALESGIDEDAFQVDDDDDEFDAQIDDDSSGMGIPVSYIQDNMCLSHAGITLFRSLCDRRTV